MTAQAFDGCIRAVDLNEPLGRRTTSAVQPVNILCENRPEFAGPLEIRDRLVNWVWLSVSEGRPRLALLVPVLDTGGLGVHEVLEVDGLPLVRGQTALGAFYRRLAVRIGKPKALPATARKLAILVYRTLSGTLVYRDPGADIYNVRQRARHLCRLKHRAETLGFALVNRETGEVLQGSVS